MTGREIIFVTDTRPRATRAWRRQAPGPHFDGQPARSKAALNGAPD